MKNNNEFLTKMANNKLLLFLVPNLICWYQLLYYYNTNIEWIIPVLFAEVIVGCIMYLFINTIIYLILNKILKNAQKVFCIMVFISVCFMLKMNLVQFLIFVAFTIFFVVDFKYLINFSLDTIICIVCFITIFLFSFSLCGGVYNALYITVNSRSYDYEIDFETDDEKDTPNIYWIHCDGMMTSETIKKYFNGASEILNIYLRNNDFYNNTDATLVNGHRTMRSLVALLNPYYYDQFYGEYLNDLEKQLMGKKKNTDFIVNYYELTEKRLNNELFQALEEKGYETIAIADYNSHTALYTDHYYDYFHYLVLGDPTKQLRYFKKGDNSKFALNLQIELTHNGVLYSNSILNDLLNTRNVLNYDVVDYNDMNLNSYPFTRDTKYWYSKAVIKAIDESFDENKNQFTFIDYKLNHYPLTFTSGGSLLKANAQNSLDSYLGNYVYSSYLLLETLKYIKTVDENAVVILQADHGIHSFENEDIMKELNVDEKGLQEIRNSVMSAIYVPEKYRNGEEIYLDNPLNISRYLVNNFVGENYQYLD